MWLIYCRLLNQVSIFIFVWCFVLARFVVAVGKRSVIEYDSLKNSLEHSIIVCRKGLSKMIWLMLMYVLSRNKVSK